MKLLIYNKQHDDFKLEVFKDSDIDELTGDAYEIIGTNLTTGETSEVTTNTPQGAIALVNNIMLELKYSSRRTN